MSYIGKIPATGNFVKLDAITTSSTNTYNLTSSSVAFTPESANHMLVSLNGVIQSPTTAFTVSGSTITFIPASGTLSSSDVIDFIMVYGNVLDIGTPSDNTVSASKLTTDSVIEAKIQNDAVTRDKINAISTSSLPSFEAKGTSGVTEGYIQLNCAENSHGIKLKSPPHSAGASYTLTFPNNDGNANEFLKTDGSGVLSWAEAGGGKLLQTALVTSSTAQTISSSTYADLTGMTLNITPVSQTSKFLITAHLNITLPTTSGGSTDIGFNSKILRDSTVVVDNAVTNDYGSIYYLQGSSNLHLFDTILGYDDHNSSSQVTIKVQGREPEGNTAKLNINSAKNSYLLVQEIEQ
jgi:hypothetical protein